MSKTRSFITAGAILGGTVIVTAAVAPLFLPNQNIKPLTSAQAAEITAHTMNSKCADCHKPGTHISELVNTLSGGLLARHIRDGQRSYNMDEPPTAVTFPNWNTCSRSIPCHPPPTPWCTGAARSPFRKKQPCSSGSG